MQMLSKMSQHMAGNAIGRFAPFAVNLFCPIFFPLDFPIFTDT